MHSFNSSLPHGEEDVAFAGNIISPTHALVLMHGRGASANNIMQLADQLSVPDSYLVVAPQAANRAWYPERFIVPQVDNQPYLNSALDRITSILVYVHTKYHIDTQQIVLAGFSQGACVVSEYLKQHSAPFQGVAIFSGGLIGTDDEVNTVTPHDLQHTPVYLGCDEQDVHIPNNRVLTTANILRTLNADVNLQIYQGLGHTIHPEGLAAVEEFLNR